MFGCVPDSQLTWIPCSLSGDSLLNTISLIIKNCSLASGSRNRLMQDLCRKQKMSQKDKWPVLHSWRHFSPTSPSGTRKRVVMQERSGGMCHPGMQGEPLEHMFSQMISSRRRNRDWLSRGVQPGPFLGWLYQTLVIAKNWVWIHFRLLISSFPASVNQRYPPSFRENKDWFLPAGCRMF